MKRSPSSTASDRHPKHEPDLEYKPYTSVEYSGRGSGFSGSNGSSSSNSIINYGISGSKCCGNRTVVVAAAVAEAVATAWTTVVTTSMTTAVTTAVTCNDDVGSDNICDM